MVGTHRPPARLLAPQQQQALDALVSWLATREREGHPMPGSPHELEDAIRHSALLHRLLVEQKPPLPVPPPCSHRSPWYELIERGFARCSVKRVDRGLVINGSLWQVVAQPGPRQYRVRYREDAPDYLVWQVGIPPAAQEDESSWMIETWTGD